MSVTPEQLAAGRAVKRALERAHDAHPNSLALHRLHNALAGLVGSFRNDIPDDDMVAFGGGTPKTDDPSDGGG